MIPNIKASWLLATKPIEATYCISTLKDVLKPSFCRKDQIAWNLYSLSMDLEDREGDSLGLFPSCLLFPKK